MLLLAFGSRIQIVQLLCCSFPVGLAICNTHVPSGIMPGRWMARLCKDTQTGTMIMLVPFHCMNFVSMKLKWCQIFFFFNFVRLCGVVVVSYFCVLFLLLLLCYAVYFLDESLTF